MSKFREYELWYFYLVFSYNYWCFVLSRDLFPKLVLLQRSFSPQRDSVSSSGRSFHGDFHSDLTCVPSLLGSWKTLKERNPTVCKTLLSIFWGHVVSFGNSHPNESLLEPNVSIAAPPEDKWRRKISRHNAAANHLSTSQLVSVCYWASEKKISLDMCDCCGDYQSVMCCEYQGGPQIIE